MQKTLVKKQFEEDSYYKNQKRLELSDILNYYKIDSKKPFKIGLEYERLSLNNINYKNAKYIDIERIITHFAQIADWELVFDNDMVIGAIDKKGSSISLEPGLQLEISLRPHKSVLDIDLELTKISVLLDKIARIYNVQFLGYGVSPYDEYDEIDLLNKQRYRVMYNYLPHCKKGESAPKMMKKTAGIQINIDYESESDAYYKLKFLNLIMPFVSALSANSPYESGQMTQLKSTRANIWRYTGVERCNIFYKDIFNSKFLKKPLFKSYVEELLKVPMIFIIRNNKVINISGKINFEQFIKFGYLDYKARAEDFILHQSLCFPDVRLKKYIEIRNHDSSDIRTTLSLCAFYKGLMQIPPKELLKRFSYLEFNNIERYNKQLIVDGLDSIIEKKYTGWQVVDSLMKIAQNNLAARERCYLEPLIYMIKTKRTQADNIIDYNINSPLDLISYLLD